MAFPGAAWYFAAAISDRPIRAAFERLQKGAATVAGRNARGNYVARGE